MAVAYGGGNLLSPIEKYRHPYPNPNDGRWSIVHRRVFYSGASQGMDSDPA